MTTDNLKQRAVSGAFWYGGSRFAIQGLTWAITILVARILTPGDYGLIGFAMLVGGVADLINEIGIGAAIIQRQDLDDEDLSAVFWFSMLFSLLIYLGAWLLSPWIAKFFNQPALTSVLRVSMLTFLLESLRIIPWNLLTKRLEFKHRSIIEFIANIISAITTLVMAYTGFGVWSLVWGMLLRHAVLTIGCQCICPWWPRLRFTWSRLQKVLGFGLNVSGGQLAWYAYSNADFLVVGKLLGQQLLGLYTMVWQLAMLPVDRIAAVVNQVAYPVYAELQHDDKKLKEYFLKIVSLIATVILPLYGGLFLVAETAIPCLLGPKWLPIITPLKIMCGVGILMTFSTLIPPIVMAKGRPDISLKYTLTCLLVMPLGFLGGARSGITGVCWAWLILYPQLVTIWYITTRRLVGYQWRELVIAVQPAAISTVAMCTLVIFSRFLMTFCASGLIRLITLVIVGIFSYIAVFIRVFKEQANETLKLFFRKRVAPNRL